MNKKARSIITISVQKGGVGKTTSSVNIASACAILGFKVLVVDLDYQRNATTLLGVKKDDTQNKKNVDFAINNISTNLDDIVIHTKFFNLDCLAATKDLSQIHNKYIGRPNQFQLLHPVLTSNYAQKYDFIFIDTHPSFDILVQSALSISDYYLIPISPESDSLEAISDQISFAEEISKYQNKELSLLGCFISRFDKNCSDHRRYSDLFATNEGDYNFFKTKIPSSKHIPAASTAKKTIHNHRPTSEIAKAYIALAREILYITQNQNAKNNSLLEQEILFN